MRPGDILRSRKGLTVEVNNTDAEGRLVLADALALADEEAPELVVSLATLTGAARVALGPDVPPFFTDDEALAADLAAASARVADPLWRLPFWTPYEPLIEPGIADLDNAPSGGMAGAITAALFLRRFVTASPRYLHLDIYGWTPSAKPARPKGAAFQAARALLAAPGGPLWLTSRPSPPRLVPARPDLAAEHLRGHVAADRFVDRAASPRHREPPRPDRAPRARRRARHPAPPRREPSPSTRCAPTAWPGARRRSTATSATSPRAVSGRREGRDGG